MQILHQTLWISGPFDCRYFSFQKITQAYKEIFSGWSMLRKTVKSGTLWESKVGYSGAIRVGSHIFVSGTTATDNVTGTVVGYNDAYAQTIQALGNIDEALRKLGAGLNDVVRTKMYVVNIETGKK